MLCRCYTLMRCSLHVTVAQRFFCINSILSTSMIIYNGNTTELVFIFNWLTGNYDVHPCTRTCMVDAAPMTCYYNFSVESYHTLSKACLDCPFNQTDCFRPHCVPGNGIKRSITVVNRMLPGPAVQVIFLTILCQFYKTIWRHYKASP